MRLNNFFKLIISVVLSEAAGVVGALFTTPAIQSGWHATLVKPTLNPPAWVFGPVWTILYALMGVALWLVWINVGTNQKTQQRAFIFFFAQLALNALWSVIFFDWHFVGGAFQEMLVLWVLILLTIVYFAKISKPAAWLLAPYILWVSFALFLNYSIWQLNPSINSGGVVCTQEAKSCPDGSFVGRTGSHCEFATCPEESNNLWEKTIDSKTGIIFSYPKTLQTIYISAVGWPAQIQVFNELFTCKETEGETTGVGQTMKRIIGDHLYCVSQKTEGAAGSTYTQYTYAFPMNNKTIVFTFTLRFVQCANYDEPNKTACMHERAAFDVDAMVDRMAQSIKF